MKRWLVPPRRVGAAVAGLSLAVACSGQASTDGVDSSAATSAATSTAAEASSSQPETTDAPSEEPTEEQVALMEALAGVLLPRDSGRLGLPSPEADCFAREVDAATPSAKRAAEQLVAEPAAWQELPDQDVHSLVLAYVGCADRDEMLALLALNALRSTDAPPCVAEAWAETDLTAEVVADSLVYGAGLSDLPDPLVDDLIAAARPCLPDDEWWVESLALVLNQQGLPPQQAECVAAAYISSVGVEELMRRRILTVPALALTPEQQAAVDVGGRCSTMVSWPFSGPPATAIAECVADFNAPDRPSTVVPCDQPHNMEAFAVEDLSDTLDEWPGARGLIQRTSELCEAEALQAIANRPELVLGTYQPSRMHWLMGNRRVGCAILRADGQPFTAPSGVLVQPTVAPFPSLVAGQCFVDADLVAGEYGDGVVDVVDCRAPHHGEVFHAANLPVPSGTPYPGDDAVADHANAACIPAFDAYVGIPFMSTSLGTWFFSPTEGSWNGGDRGVICFLYDSGDDDLTKSMAGARV